MMESRGYFDCTILYYWRSMKLDVEARIHAYTRGVRAKKAAELLQKAVMYMYVIYFGILMTPGKKKKNRFLYVFSDCIPFEVPPKRPR